MVAFFMFEFDKVFKSSYAIRLWLCLIVLATVSACQTPKRDCPVFYHRDASLLLPGSVGSTYRFIDAEKNIDEYKIESIDMNEPYTMIGRYARYSPQMNLNVICEMTRNVRLISTDMSRGFEFNFTHKGTLKQAIENQLFTLEVTLLSLSEEEAVEKQWLDFTFSRPQPYKDEYFRYYPSKVINGKEYADVYIKNAYGTTNVKPTPFLLNRIVLSKGHGLIQFRLVDNTEYNIVTN